MFSITLLKKLVLSHELRFFCLFLHLQSYVLQPVQCLQDRTGIRRKHPYVKAASTSANIHNPPLPQPPPSSSIRQYVLIPVFTSLCLFHRLLSLKLAVIKKTEFTKKMETQTSSPSKRSTMKPAVRQARPNQHHSCPRRRTTGDPSSWSVAQGGALCCCFSAARTQFLNCFTSFGFFFSLSISCVSLFFIPIKFLMTHFILSNCVIILFSSLFFSHKCNVTLSRRSRSSVIKFSLFQGFI